MGGKNAIIVDDDADLDEAVRAIVAVGVRLRRAEMLGLLARASSTSAVYDAFVERLVERTRSLQVGPAEDPATDVPP